MKKSFEVSGVCAKRIDVDVDNNTINSVEFSSGCPGNLMGISKLVQGRQISEVVTLLEGVTCGTKNTSCPDQLAKTLKGLC